MRHAAALSACVRNGIYDSLARHRFGFCFRYPAAEMKHGPIALIDEFMPVVIIAPRSDPNYRKLVSNIEEVRGSDNLVRVPLFSSHARYQYRTIPI
jgi:hypothetical protein